MSLAKPGGPSGGQSVNFFRPFSIMTNLPDGYEANTQRGELAIVYAEPWQRGCSAFAAAESKSLIPGQMADLAKENLGDIYLAADESDVFKWTAILPGPVGSPYEGGRFEVEIVVPTEYP